MGPSEPSALVEFFHNPKQSELKHVNTKILFLKKKRKKKVFYMEFGNAH